MSWLVELFVRGVEPKDPVLRDRVYRVVAYVLGPPAVVFAVWWFATGHRWP